ncbi:MAG: GDP-mannose 4,6-dehydratase [Candidatus Omnitrophota bacterium]
MKTAIITGITGQDGPYLAKLLLEKKYRIIGLWRGQRYETLKNLDYLKIRKKVKMQKCNLLNLPQLLKIIEKYQPDELYNLAAQSSVNASFQKPQETVHFNLISVLNLLEAIKMVNRKIKFYQASSSEMFGRVMKLPIREDTAMHPLSPYAVSKAAAHWMVVNYRESYGLFAGCGIFFNHESYLRGDNFFVKKVIRESLNIKYGRQRFLRVGNIDVKRDFGYAPKYVEAMWLLMQQKKADSFIICSGKSVYLREVIYYVFDRLKIKRNRLKIDRQLYRPADIQDLYGDNSKAKKILGWKYDLDFFDVLDILIEEEERNYYEN